MTRAPAASLFGYTKLYGQVPGGQAELLRVPHADYGPIKVPEGPPDDRFVYLSDVLPTAWQAVEWADVRAGRQPRRARSRPDRRHGLPHRPAPRDRDGDRRSTESPNASPERAERGIDVLDLDDLDATRNASPMRCATAPTAVAPTA